MDEYDRAEFDSLIEEHAIGYTEDGQPFYEGSRLFNYYDRQAGVVGKFDPSDGWFDFHHDDGQFKMLNHERVCSIEFAKKKGWLQ